MGCSRFAASAPFRASASHGARNERVALFSSAIGGTPLDVAIPVVTAHESSGARTRVPQTTDDGGELSGWVATDELTRFEGGGGRGYGIGIGSCGCPKRPTPTVRIATRRGNSRLRARAKDEGAGRWATVTVSTEFNAVEVGSDWLHLVGLWRSGIYETFAYPGYPCNDLRAFVKRVDVRGVGPVRY